MKGIVITAVAVLVLSGCAGMDESECLTADWQMIGFEDGSVGKSQSNIGEYRKACADHGITPSLTQYQEGYAKGIRNYCAQSNGFDQGKRGVEYKGICPHDMEADFVEAYSLGREYYVLSRAVSSLSSKISSGENRIKSLEKAVAQNVLTVANDETSSEDRVALMLKIKDQHSEISELKDKIPDYEDELAHKRAEYDSLEQPLFH